MSDLQWKLEDALYEISYKNFKAYHEEFILINMKEIGM